MKTNLLHGVNINFYYGQQEIIKNVHFSVNQGDFVVLSGDNGSGKSTLLKIILGQLMPSSGAVQIFGVPVGKFKDFGRLGYLAQDEHSRVVGFPANVLEIVMANLYKQVGRFKLPSKKHKEQAMNALRTVNMEEYAYVLPKELSGGQLQRILLAKAIVSKPEFLILDEPTTGVDESSVEALYNLFDKLHDEGTSFLVITHDVEGIRNIGNRFLHIENKSLVEQVRR